MNILLTGATGFIGSHLLNRLLQKGHHVTACIRQPDKQYRQDPRLNVTVVDFMQATRLDDWLPLLMDIDVVINAVGIISESRQQSFAKLHTDAPAALFSAAQKAGVKRVLQISALGADQDAKSAYHLSKLAADDVLASLDLDWFILRPSLVYGTGAVSMGLFRALSALPVIPLIEGGTQNMQPVHIDDLVEAVILCIGSQLDERLDQNVPTQLTLDVVGPDEISMKALLFKQRQWLGLANKKAKASPKTFSISLAWLLKLMPFTFWLDEPVLTADSLKMLQRGNTADDSMMQAVLGEAPESIDSALARTPATTADRWYAKLYFMRPLLRLGIAFVWIWTALVSAFFYPQAESYQLLQQIGLSGFMLPIALYGSALMDLLLGLGMFFYKPLRHILWLQMLVILAYTIAITLFLPEYWLHPFGEISKNIPMILATFVLLLINKK